MTVYFINTNYRHDPPQLIKIGFSEEPPNRSRAGRTWLPWNIIILTREGDKRTESKYHKKFAFYREGSSEIFRFTPEMLTWTPDDEPTKETFDLTFAPALNTYLPNGRLDPGDLTILERRKIEQKPLISKLPDPGDLTVFKKLKVKQEPFRFNLPDPGDLSHARLIQKTSRRR